MKKHPWTVSWIPRRSSKLSYFSACCYEKAKKLGRIAWTKDQPEELRIAHTGIVHPPRCECVP